MVHRRVVRTLSILQGMEFFVITQTPDGKDIFFKIEGSGPDLLLIHGAASDADTMAPLVSELSGRYRCISVDRGYRRSTHLSRDTTVEEQAHAIEAVRKAFTSDPLWVFGHSSGGNVAVGYASLFPNNVRGLILMEPALYALYPPDAFRPAIDRMRNELIPMFQRGDIGDGINGFVELLELSRETLVELGRLPSTTHPAENWLPFAHDQPFVIDWCPSVSDIQRLTHRILVLEGDRTTPLLRNICRLLTEKLPKAQLTTLVGCDHVAPLLRPRLVAEKISEFIATYGNAF
jgi:pimeloyl-ACP methyl ester carboxylesterase